MNIQIFGTKKCNDTKKAERFFKERGIKFQFIDMKEKGMSKGELTSVASFLGGIEALVNPDAKDQDALALFPACYYDREALLIPAIQEAPWLLRTPIVRNGKQATVGYQPDVWKKWE